MFVYKGHCLAIGVGIQVNNLFYYTTSIRVVQGAKYEIPQTRSIPAIITYPCCFDLANRSMGVSEVRISKAISYATKALGYSELRPNQELAGKHFLRGHDVFVSLPPTIIHC